MVCIENDGMMFLVFNLVMRHELLALEDYLGIEVGQMP